MTKGEFIAKWQARYEELTLLKAMVDGAIICGEVLADFRAIAICDAEDTLSLREAAEASGYSEGHLARLVRDGKVPDLRPAGSKKPRLPRN